MSSRLTTNRWRFVEAALFLVLIPVAFFLLRGLAFPGGDSGEMANRIRYPWQFFMRAPLVILLNKTIWVLLNQWGWSAEECIALSSSLAGGVYFLSLWWLTRDPRVWGLCLLSKTIFIFTGHIENYAWPYALSLFCFALLKKHREGLLPSWLVWATAGLTFFFHPMTLMIWPGLAWGLERWNRPKLAEIIGALVLVVAVFDLFLVVGNVDGFFTRSWFLTLGEGQLCPYSILSWEHWRLLFGFHIFTLPLGVILLAWRWRWLQPGWPQGVGLTAVIALIWSACWCPSMGAEDWDLFAYPALFVNLAGGLGFVSAKGHGADTHGEERAQAYSDNDR